MVLKPGREVLDPLNRVVTIIALSEGMVVVRLAGPYGATIFYPQSCVRPVPMSKCVVVLDRFGDLHAKVFTGLALPAAKELVRDLGLDDMKGEWFQYTIVESGDPGAARLIARGQTVVGQFRMDP